MDLPTQQTAIMNSSPLDPKKFPWIPMLLSFLIGILFTVSAFLAYQYFNKPAETTSDVVPSPSPANDAPQTGASPTSTWKTYTIKELGITFKYPPSLQPMDYPNGLETKGEKGTQLCLSFIPFTTSFHIIKLVHAGGGSCQGIFAIGSTSINYEEGRGGGFGDIQSYVKSDTSFKANSVLGQQFNLPAELVHEIINPNGVKILVIEGKNTTQFSERGSEPISGTPGDGFIGAILNTPQQPYAGFNIQMKLSKQLTKELFDQILSTFKFTNN